MSVIVPAAKYSLKAPPERRRFKEALLALPGYAWTEKAEQHCDYRLDGQAAAGGWVRAKQFSNGTLYLEAGTDALLSTMTALLAPGRAVQPSLPGVSAATPKAAKAKASGQLNIQGAYIGTDESGKGDYFGSLVVAGVLVTDQTAAILTELGVMDSKKLNERQIEELHLQIRQVVGEEAVSVVEIGPAKYNELYDRLKSRGKNLNHLLAWAHATAIENLLARFPDCTQAVADQFGDERYILAQLKEKGKGITLYQTPRAEANVGVAAASIVARARFTQKQRQLSARFGVDLPFGANPLVKDRARLLIARHGKDALREVAKLHFKTTQEL